MPNLPIRGLGSVGVVTDVDPYNLPPMPTLEPRTLGSLMVM